jgi:hypothetical protein
MTGAVLLTLGVPMRKHLATMMMMLAMTPPALALDGTDSRPQGGLPGPGLPATVVRSLTGSDSNPTGVPEVSGPAAVRASVATPSAATAATATTVYFTPQDENTSTTNLFLYNTNATADTVALQTFYTNGSLTLSTNIAVPALSMVRISGDAVSSTSASWASPTLVNFTTFSAYAKMVVPPGVKYSGYVAWDTTGVYDPLSSLEALPLRFTMPAVVPSTVYFTPQDENTSTTVLFLYNLNAAPATVDLKTFYLGGTTTLATSIVVPALGMVRLCGDAVSTVSASWAGASLVNFTTFSAYAQMNVPAGVLYEGYVAWNTTGSYDPLVATQTLPLRFDSDVNVTLGVPPAPESPGLQSLRTAPNPAMNGSRVSFSLARAEEVDLAVYDAAGRLVQHLAHGTLAAGDHSFAWDGRTASRGEAAAGVYFVRLHSPSHDLDTRVVKLH